MQVTLPRFPLAWLVGICLLPAQLLAQQSRPATGQLSHAPFAEAITMAKMGRAGAPTTASTEVAAAIAPCYTCPPVTLSCNLVANPTFDNQLMIPTGVWGNVAGPGATESNVANWRCGSYGTADYFATNAPNPSWVHPATAFPGAFTPHNNNTTALGAHNGCGGIIARRGVGPVPLDYPEYIAQTLPAALKNGSSYFVSFWALRGSVSQVATKLTLNITDTDPSTAPWSLTPFSPSTYSITSQSPIVDASDWTRVCGIVTMPNGDSQYNARYINIGTMLPDVQMVDPSASEPAAYYYIDDVEIYEIPVAAVPTQNYSCFGATGADIGAGCTLIPGATYQWKATRLIDGSPATTGLPTNPTSPTNHVYPTEPTCYALTVTLPCAGSHTTSVCTYPSDWIGLTAQSHNIGNYTPLTNGSSAPVCNGYSVDFQAVTQVAYAPYIWTVNNITMPTTSWYSSYSSPGFDMSMGQSFAAINIKPKTAGLYTVTVSGTGICSSSNVSATFTFNYDPNVYCRPANAGPEPVAMPDPTTKLSVYPNPAAEQVSIPAGLQRAQVLDAMNHSVLERSQPGAILDVRALPEGLYQLRLVQPDGRVQTQRLVIKH